MKTEKNILIAFILNLIFSIFEFNGICHAILETEDEACDDVECSPHLNIESKHYHKHHH